jgi:predicted nucleic acid-binding protein
VALRVAIVDTGPLYAAVDHKEPRSDEAQNVLQMAGIIPVVPALVVGEVLHFIERKLGPEVEARFLEGLHELDVRAPLPEDWARIGALVRQYLDFPLGGVDASVVALAERLDTDLVITFDHRHFAAIRPRHAPHFTLLPSLS